MKIDHLYAWRPVPWVLRRTRRTQLTVSCLLRVPWSFAASENSRNKLACLFQHVRRARRLLVRMRATGGFPGEGRVLKSLQYHQLATTLIQPVIKRDLNPIASHGIMVGWERLKARSHLEERPESPITNRKELGLWLRNLRVFDFEELQK